LLLQTPTPTHSHKTNSSQLKKKKRPSDHKKFSTPLLSCQHVKQERKQECKQEVSWEEAKAEAKTEAEAEADLRRSSQKAVDNQLGYDQEEEEGGELAQDCKIAGNE